MVGVALAADTQMPNNAPCEALTLPVAEMTFGVPTFKLPIAMIIPYIRLFLLGVVCQSVSSGSVTILPEFVPAIENVTLLSCTGGCVICMT
jgi:hypothetical protein